MIFYPAWGQLAGTTLVRPRLARRCLYLGAMVELDVCIPCTKMTRALDFLHQRCKLPIYDQHEIFERSDYVVTVGSRSVPLFPILFVNLIGTLGFALVLPFLVFLVTDWGGNAFVYGLAGATYSVFQLIGAPILGRWSDSLGRRRVLLFSQAGTLLSWLIFMVAFFLPQTQLARFDSSVTGSFVLTVPLAVLFLARALDGITGGNVSVANAYLADISSADQRAANFGKMAVSSNLGFILGPALAGVLGATAWEELAPIVAAAVISFVATLAIVFYLPESTPCMLDRNPERGSVRKMFGQEQRDCYELETAPKLGVGTLLRSKSLATLLAMYFLVMFAFNLFYVSFPIYAVTGLAWSLTDTGLFFTVMGLLMVLVQGPILARLSRAVKENFLIVAGGAALAVGFLLFNTRHTEMVYVAVTLLAIGNGVMWPSVMSLLASAAGDTYQGAVQGFAGSLGAVASIAGLTLGGVLFANIGASVFVVSAAVIAATTVVGLTVVTDSPAS